MRLNVIIPVYNEVKTIGEVIENVAAQQIEGVEIEIVVVDDGSTDGSRDVIEAKQALLAEMIFREKNGGKGAAARDGLVACKGDYIVFQDADLEYSPSEFKSLVLPIFNFDAEVVIGSRFIAPKYTRVHYFWHKVGNRAITFFFNIFNNTTFSDIYSCYLMFRRNLISPASLQTNGWEQQAEILSKLMHNSKIYYEVPISYCGRTYSEGKKIRAIHTIAVFWAIVKYKFRS